MTGASQLVGYDGLTTGAAVVEKGMRESNCIVLNNWSDSLSPGKGLTCNIKGTLLASNEWGLQALVLLFEARAIIGRGRKASGGICERCSDHKK